MLVSGNGTNLQSLINSCNSKTIKSGKIELVISSNKNAFALERAKQANIKTAIVCKKECLNEQEFNNKLFEVLDENSPDLIVLAGFIQIICSKIIDRFKNKILNVHPSLIPAFCGIGCFGIHVHEKALNRGVKITGATVHFVNEIADGGPIVIQKSVKILDNDTPKTLQQRVMEQAEWKILPEAVELFCSNQLEIINEKVIIKKGNLKCKS